MTESNEPQDDEQPVCCECGSTENLTYGPDPYASEIHGNETPVWLCESCYRKSIYDI